MLGRRLESAGADEVDSPGEAVPGDRKHACPRMEAGSGVQNRIYTSSMQPWAPKTP